MGIPLDSGPQERDVDLLRAVELNCKYSISASQCESLGAVQARSDGCCLPVGWLQMQD